MSVETMVSYKNARDKIVGVWERFDDTLPDHAKPRYRQLMFEYLIDTFGSWEQSGDSLPSAEALYFYARLRKKVS